MNIKEFVKDVLVNVNQAVDEARSETKRDISFTDTKDQRTVEFDIAVSVEETGSKNSKAGIKVLQFAEAGGGLSKENKNATVSRIKFGVHIDSKTKDENASQNAAIKTYNQNLKNDFSLD